MSSALKAAARENDVYEPHESDSVAFAMIQNLRDYGNTRN